MEESSDGIATDVSADFVTTNEGFLVEEFRALRAEIDLLADLSFRVERNAAGIIILIYGLVFSESIPITASLALWLWFLPPLVCLLCLTRLHNIRLKIHFLGAYIKDYIEPKLAPDGRGWEAFLTKKFGSAPPGWVPSRLWALLLSLSSFAAASKALGFH